MEKGEINDLQCWTPTTLKLWLIVKWIIDWYKISRWFQSRLNLYPNSIQRLTELNILFFLINWLININIMIRAFFFTNKLKKFDFKINILTLKPTFWQFFKPKNWKFGPELSEVKILTLKNKNFWQKNCPNYDII